MLDAPLPRSQYGLKRTLFSPFSDAICRKTQAAGATFPPLSSSSLWAPSICDDEFTPKDKCSQVIRRLSGRCLPGDRGSLGGGCWSRSHTSHSELWCVLGRAAFRRCSSRHHGSELRLRNEGG